VDQVAGFLEAFSGLRSIPNEAGYAFERGDDLADADPEVLRRTVALRDLLLGIQDYLRVCGGNGRVPGVLIWHGDEAQQELERRHEWPYYGPPSRRRAPSREEEGKPEVKEKKQVPKRRRGQIPDVEVGGP
jgi:hypothetical protein